MSRGEKKFICISLLLIIFFSSILIYKIKSDSKYDEELYNEIYSEYEDILLSIESNTIEEDVNTSNTIYMQVNSQGQQYRVAGEISIPKLGISYPIIYETTEEYLKIAPTKLYGPNINEVGNFCIVGHNYKSKKFFSKLSELENNDKVVLMNNEGKSLTYLIFNKYEVLETDLSCTSQDTNGNIELTLITCTNNRNKRLVVKCRAM